MAVLQSGLIAESITAFVTDLQAAIPRLIAGIVFLVLAGLGVKVIMIVIRAALQRAYPGESPVYRQFLATIAAVFLWFAVGLSFFSVVGLDGIAASLGTGAGFLALGISYALSGMIEDAVAGVYLLRDPDFMPGDRIAMGSTEGVVESIELRKTRLDVEGNTLVRANAEIEEEWTKLAEGEPADD